MYILLMKEWTIVSNGFIMYMIWLVFETFEQTQPKKNWKENEKVVNVTTTAVPAVPIARAVPLIKVNSWRR